MDELTKLIDQMVHEKTFSMEGVEAVKALRDQAVALEDQVENLLQDHENDKRDLDGFKAKVLRLEKEGSDLRSRESAVIEREKKMTELEKATAVANAKADTFKECVGLVFRNATLRREMFGQQPVADNSGFTTSQPKSETVIETVD